MNAKQEEALREYLQEAIVPMIEQVLVKKLGQAMTYASKELIQPKRDLSDDEFVAEAHKRGFFVNTPPKREWQGLTEQEIGKAYDDYQSGRISSGFNGVCRAIEAKLKEKNHDQ